MTWNPGHGMVLVYKLCLTPLHSTGLCCAVPHSTSLVWAVLHPTPLVGVGGLWAAYRVQVWLVGAGLRA